MYETLGHGEACRVTLDNGTAVSRKQMTALLKYYFEVRRAEVGKGGQCARQAGLF